MKFSKQLFLLFAISTAVPIMVMWFTLSEIMYEKEINDVKAKHLLIAKNLGAALHRYHKDITSGFQFVSTNLVAGNKVTNLDHFVTSLNFRHFCVADAQTGRVVTQASPEAVPCPDQVPAKRFALFKSLATSETPVFSPVLPGPKKQSLIYILQKFGDKIAIGAVNTDYFITLGKAVSFGIKGHAAIVDQQGNVLAHPNASWTAARKNIAKVSTVKRMMAGETGVQTFFSPALKADMIAGFTSIEGAGWGVMIPQPISELRLAAETSRRAIFPVIAISIILAGLVALLVARMVLKPLNSMIKVAKAVEQGEHDVTVTVDNSWHVPHEFKDMQQRFSAMAKAVSKYQAEQELERVAVEQDSKTKSEYLANLAHELKTPLNSILGFSNVLRKAVPGTLKAHEEHEFLGHIEKSAGHLLSFVNDLLDLNRLDMGAHKIQETEFFLSDAIRFCETTLRKEVDKKQISLSVALDEKCLKVLADERAVNQILINLMSNAVRYSFDKGKIEIFTGLLANGDYQIEIRDNGIGISEKDLEHIMLPFKRGTDPSLADIHGTGLGLSIVGKLARLQDMSFTIESEHGFNTTARLIIPKVRVVSCEEEAA